MGLAHFEFYTFIESHSKIELIDKTREILWRCLVWRSSNLAKPPLTPKILNSSLHLQGSSFSPPFSTSQHQPHTMSRPFDYAADRPEHIDSILNGLDRYNPETTAVFQDYVMQQCENQTYDAYANLALLKLYVISRHYFLSPHSVMNIVPQRFLFPEGITSLNHSPR